MIHDVRAGWENDPGIQGPEPPVREGFLRPQTFPFYDCLHTSLGPAQVESSPPWVLFLDTLSNAPVQSGFYPEAPRKGCCVIRRRQRAGGGTGG